MGLCQKLRMERSQNHEYMGIDRSNLARHGNHWHQFQEMPPVHKPFRKVYTLGMGQILKLLNHKRCTTSITLSIEVEASPLDRCMSKLKFISDYNSVIKVSGEEQLNAFCVNITDFLSCTNNVLKQETGFDIKGLAELLEGTEIGNALKLMVNVENLVGDLCTEGNEFREDYLENSQCLIDMDAGLATECEKQAKDAYTAFTGLQIGSRREQVDEPCMLSAYLFGCLGAEVKEECGEDGFRIYKEVVKRVGMFKSGVCPDELLNTIKTSFISSLDMSDSRKSIYRLILELRKRRK